MCEHPGCKLKVKYNFKNETIPLYCNKHKLEGMVNVTLIPKKQRIISTADVASVTDVTSVTDMEFNIPIGTSAAEHFDASAAVLTIPSAYVSDIDIPKNTWLNMDDVRINTKFILSHTTNAGRAHVASMATHDTAIISRFNAFLNMTPSSFGECHVYTSSGCIASSKILAFDMDNTLIKPSIAKAKFCSSHDDWEWFSPHVVHILHAAHTSGYKIVIFTNQGGISKGHTTLDIVKKRCEAMISDAGVPMQIFVAPNSDFYRKPATGMYWLLATKFNNGIPINTSESMYVGDAAGRPKSKTHVKDHSATDLAFAINCGLQFEVPEDLFNIPSERNSWHSTAVLNFITPKRLPPPLENDADVTEYRAMLRPISGQEIVLLVGLPGSGKSTLCNIGFPDYERINQDLLKTRNKCVAAATAAISRGSSIIIDATNTHKDARDNWDEFAKKAKIPIRTIVLPFDRDISFHYDTVRSINPLGGIDGITDNRHVPSIVIYGMAKSYDPPSGKNVLNIIPSPGPFTNSNLQKLTLKTHGVDPLDVIAFSDFWRSLTYAVYS